MDIPTFFAEVSFDRDRWSAIAAIFFLIAALVWLFIWLIWAEDSVDGDDSVSGESDTAKALPTPVPAKALSGDDFGALGLSSYSAQGLYGDGVTKYGQIADWSDDDTVRYGAKYGKDNPSVEFKDLPWKANALANGVNPDSIGEGDSAFGPPHSAPAEVDHDQVISTEFSGEDVENDKDLGVVYAKAATPSHEDELSAIKGVGPKISKELNDYGVFCYKQIANWSDHNVAEFAERLNCFKGRIERDRWIPQAASLDCKGGEEEFSAATEEEAASLFAEELSSGQVRQDEVYGIVYSEAPADIDDLKKIKGIAKVFEGRLHDIGVYRFKQIAVWTDAACKQFSSMMTFKNRIYTDNWLAQAKALHEEKYDEKL